HWLGGFQRFTEGKQTMAAPDIESALAAESLAEACRVARQAGDLPRLQRYERALLLNLHFLMSLQYTIPRVQHFVSPSVRRSWAHSTAPIRMGICAWTTRNTRSARWCNIWTPSSNDR